MNTNDLIKQLTDTVLSIGKDGICIAFSGGVDSAVLLKIASGLPVPSAAVTFQTLLHPQPEITAAKTLAQQFGVKHHVIQINELENPRVIQNQPDRCYHCKHMLFEKLLNYARDNDLQCCADGTNADDLKEYRPGLRALDELGIKSPLAMCGFSKEQVRSIAAELGLSVASKPSAPCLATRFPYGEQLVPVKLERIGQAEEYLKKLGFLQVRVRSHNNLSRIEITEDSFSDFMAKYRQITKTLKAYGFDYITLDLEGFRSGSMDINIKK